MTGWLREALYRIDVAAMVYFLLLNTSYLILLLLASIEFAGHRRRTRYSGGDDMFRSPLTPPVSVIVPAYNEGPGIVEAVRSIMALHYPRFEIVVVDDGSTDDTFTALAAAFGLVETPRAPVPGLRALGAVRSVHVAADEPDRLMVVRKANGGKADALNVGIALASSPLVCMVDADSLLDPEALLTVARPFADDPLRVVATGGVIRIVNDCEVVAGRVVGARMPRRWLPRIQVIEYLRSFLLGRAGWSRVGSLVVISGAFGLFRRDDVIAAGGMATDCIGEDAELVVRLHHTLRRAERDYRVTFVSEPVSWSEAPNTWRVLRKQRARWHRGLAEIIWRHRGMVFNPRYGRIGMIAMPWYLLFELLAPVIELAALVLVPLGLALSVVDIDFAWRFLLASYGYAVVISLVALLAEEIAYHRYPRWRDLGIGLAAAVLENVGYRQVLALWQVEGLWAAVRGRRHVWGEMSRAGFVTRERP
ncbi:glycosyl transferase family 2 [Pilimelia terevasa]|uniref:Glycosyl transferase family 2 n=1 Tax=Pilimelia terevasa TaxID=53372 RepID=A0A8J3BR18_9ACTN|nr:glycosyltransferase [Pilimelia terevasa]GGK37946.1 glycosyl transferase family 2 [Pilimelia terevasa]